VNEEDKWNALMRSIRKAARILNIDLSPEAMPEYMNWLVARTMHRYLWDQVYLKRR